MTVVKLKLPYTLKLFLTLTHNLNTKHQAHSRIACDPECRSSPQVAEVIESARQVMFKLRLGGSTFLLRCRVTPKSAVTCRAFAETKGWQPDMARRPITARASFGWSLAALSTRTLIPSRWIACELNYPSLRFEVNVLRKVVPKGVLLRIGMVKSELSGTRTHRVKVYEPFIMRGTGLQSHRGIPEYVCRDKMVGKKNAKLLQNNLFNFAELGLSALQYGTLVTWVTQGVSFKVM
ncbi:hypothetical protein BKA82DRAFT_4016601 [Pisolithus tinctorius]|nr:hypothetical protein BKA82DRAFT_4016601 [Pisolithus tinctorius]